MHISSLIKQNMGLVVEHIFKSRSFHTVSKLIKMFCTVNTVEKESKNLNIILETF
jgi:hypothetical protein